MKCRAALAGVAALFLLFGCSAEKPPLKPDNAINETISRQLAESPDLMLDEVTAPWDTVLIDSAYSAPHLPGNVKGVQPMSDTGHTL